MALLAALLDKVIRVFGRSIYSAANQQCNQSYGNAFPGNAVLVLGSCGITFWRTRLVMAQTDNARL